MNSRFSVLCGLLLSVVGLLPGQSPVGVITGTVVDARDGSPIVEARVQIVGLTRATITDSRGNYRFADVPSGTHLLVTRQIGYAPDTARVSIEAGQRLALETRLREAAIVLDPLTVSGTRELERRVEGSLTIDALSGSEVRRTRAAHPSGILNRLAGVHVTQTSGEGHMMAMRMKISTSPVYLFLEDGIPTRPTGFFNHNALYEVNLPQAGGIEVIKGPGTALYGSDAIGGIVNVMTQPPPFSPSVEVNAEGGGNGYRRLMATGGGTWGDHGVRADVNLTHSDNWFDDAPYDRISASLRWDALIGSWSARTVITGSKIDQQDVPAISRELYESTPYVNQAPIAYRNAEALRISTAFEREAGNSLLSITPYARLNEMGLLPSWQLTYDPQTWLTRNTSVGLLARYRRDIAPWNGRIIVGVDADLSPGSQFARQAIVSRSGPINAWVSYTDGDVHYDYDVTYHGISPYLQTQWNPITPLRFDVGLRADFAGYDYDTRLEPVSTGNHRVPADTSVSYSHLSPKVGATWAFSDAVNVYGSWRHGFRVPSFGQLFTQNSAVNTVGLKPVTVDSWEAGIRGNIGPRFVYQVAAYSMAVSNDIITYVTPENTREARNAGSTRHRGIEASAGVAITPRLRLDASYAIGDHKYLDWTPQAATETTPEISYAGNKIEQAPDALGNVMLTWSPSLLRGGRVAVEWTTVGRYAQDPGNIGWYDGHQLVNLHANANVTHNAELFLRVTNLTDRRYAELSSYTAFLKDTYSPGMPRSVYGGVKYAW